MATRRPSNRRAGGGGRKRDRVAKPTPKSGKAAPTRKRKAGKPRGKSPAALQGPAPELVAYVASQPPNSKLTVERVQLLEAAALAGVPLVLAAESAGISRQTLWDWREKHSYVSDILTRAESTHAVIAMRRIVQAAECGDWRADAWWLERRCPEEFSRTQKIKGKVDVGLDWAELVAELDSSGPDQANDSNQEATPNGNPQEETKDGNP